MTYGEMARADRDQVRTLTDELVRDYSGSIAAGRIIRMVQLHARQLAHQGMIGDLLLARVGRISRHALDVEVRVGHTGSREARAV